MKLKYRHLLNVYSILLLLITLSFKLNYHSVSCEPITGSIAGILGAIGLSATYASWNYIKCSTQECCHDINEKPVISASLTRSQWIRYDLPNFDNDLKSNLYGQPLATKIVTRLVKHHIKDNNPDKPLVLSFHGWTGSGKNHVTRILARNLFEKFNQNQRSSFFNVIIGTHFAHDTSDEQLANVREFLRNNVTEGVKKCPRSVFVFDEIDKMPSGVIDAIKPFLDYHPNVNGIDYRKAIFIFLSNTGGNEIIKVSYDFWRKGKNREEISMKEIEPHVNSGAFNEKGGLHKSDIVEKHLIDAYVPFLPLERKHVELCVRDYIDEKYPDMKERNSFIQEVADELEYYPVDTKLYSKSGCKKIQSKIHTLIF